MPVSGLIALLDDIATIADDVATLTVAATKKTSGIVTDDMAVTAEQTIGIRRERELAVVFAVARGSFFNKAVLLAPGALILNAVAPWSITPVLMAGGSYLAFEGVEKILHKMAHHEESHTDAAAAPTDPDAFERMRIRGAIRTDLILSGEIITITLGQVAASPFVNQVLVLYAVSVVLTVGVYGLVGVLVKLDDAGEYLVGLPGASRQRLGRAILWFAPWLLHAITWVGTIAMLMVGGHIVLEGVHPAYEFVHHFVEHLPVGVSFLVGSLIDIGIGAVIGLFFVGVMATGIPARLWALRPWGKT